MGKGKRYKVVLKGYSITEEGTGAGFNEAESLTYHNMSYEQVCLLEEKIMNAFQEMNKAAQAAAAAKSASPVSSS